MKKLFSFVIAFVLAMASFNAIAKPSNTGDRTIGILQTRLRAIATLPVVQRERAILRMVYPPACREVREYYRVFARKMPSVPSLQHIYPGGQDWWHWKPQLHLLVTDQKTDEAVYSINYNEDTRYFEIILLKTLYDHWRRGHEDEAGMRRRPGSWYVYSDNC